MITILTGDVRDMLATLPDESVHCVVTSPPYWGLRDYGTAEWEGGDPGCGHVNPAKNTAPSAKSTLTTNGGKGPLPGDKYHHGSGTVQFLRACEHCGAKRIDRQIGMEPTMGEHITVMVSVFREVRRVMRKDATCWLNYGDCYATVPNGRSAADTKATGNDDRTFRDKPFSTVGGTLKAKDLCMIPNRLAIALQDDGWWVRSEIIWAKPNPMPESVTDRPATAHEKIWLLTKSARYFYDAEAVRRPAANSTLERWAQDIDAQTGSHRAHAGGKTNGPMKAVGGIKRKRPNGTPTQEFIPGENTCGVAEGGANLRNVWTIPTKGFSGAHYATFPPDLIVPCIKAGTSEKGCCAECGAPWVRETVSEQISLQATNGPEKQEAVTGWDRSKWPRTRKVSDTTGWSPSCQCNATTVPCTILDPFIGSGTTAMVADRLGRNCIGVDLNPENAEMAKDRITDDAGMFAEIT